MKAVNIMKKHQIAVMGYGVVGSGVVEAFYNNVDNICRRIGCSVDIRYILDIRTHSGTPFDEKFITDFEKILTDPEVTAVAEVIGGLDPAYEYTKRLLNAGKSVVTSNKELVAQKGAELLEIAQKNGVLYLFEASVGGGIPIIRPLRRCLIGNRIEQIAGILNGTTNFILTKMFEEKMSFEDALKMAQRLGYAERNPAADVEGQDACRKICILSSLISGYHVYPDEVHTEGITNITRQDVAAAEQFNCSMKLIAYCNQLENGQIQAVVAPMLVTKENRLYNIRDLFNGITVRGDAVGDVAFYGRGAGKLPTASAVISDLAECIYHVPDTEPPLWQQGERRAVTDYRDIVFSYMLRLSKSDVLPLLESIVGKAVSTAQCDDELWVITPPISHKKLEQAQKTVEENGSKLLAAFRVLQS